MKNNDIMFTFNGLGFNNYNYIMNATNRISSWLLKTHKDALYMSDQERAEVQKKLEQIINIIES